MHRKTKIQLAALVYIPFALVIPILAAFYFTPYTVCFTKISYLFALLCFVIPFIAIGKWKIGGENVQRHSTLEWLLMIFIAEIGIVSLFLIQSNVLITALIKTGNIYPSLDIIHQIIIPSLFMNWGLFPWTLFAIVSVIFAYVSYTKNPYLPFNKNPFNRYKLLPTIIVRRTIDIYIQTSSRFFLLFLITCLALQTGLFFYPNIQLFSPLYSLVIGGTLLVLFSTKSIQNALRRIEEQKRRQGLHLIIMFIATVLIIIASIVMVDKLPAPMKHLYQHFTVPFSQLKHPKSALSLWNWCFWILSAPLFCSLIVKFSQGRSARQVLAAVLALPVILIALTPFIKDILINGLITIYITHWIYLPLIISLVLLTYFLLDKEIDTYLWLGFIPIKKQQKTRRLTIEYLWTFFIVILSLVLLLNLSGCLLMGMPGAPICLIIFFLLLFNRTKSK